MTETKSAALLEQGGTREKTVDEKVHNIAPDGTQGVLNAALAYAGRGWPVFPCSPTDKKPLTPNGFKNATTNPTTIREWWTRWSDAMIGLPTGVASGIWAVDCDSQESLAHFKSVCASIGFDPERTLVQLTPRGGCHYLFKLPDGELVKNSASKLFEHLDIRGDGGYVITAPSLRDDGVTYRWRDPSASPIDTPKELVTWANSNPKQESQTSSVPRVAWGAELSPYTRRAIENEVAAVASASKGERNERLNRAAFCLGQLVGGGDADENTVRVALERAAHSCGLVSDDGLTSAQNTIRSGLEAGKKEPRSIPLQKTAQESGKESLSPGFSIRNGGLWHTEVKEGADPVETYLGPELTIEGMTRDANSNAWGLLLSWKDPDGIKHTWAMPRDLLAGRDTSAWLGRLAFEGYAVSPISKAKNLLALFLASYRTSKRARCVPCTGWHGDAFVLPDVVFYVGKVGNVGNGNDSEVVTLSDIENGMSEMSEMERVVLQVKTPHNPFHTAGTMDGWRDTIGTMARGNSRLVLSICTALAAPLLELIGMESGGFNFVGGSSTGKTTALDVGASVWGKGTSSGGYVLNWRATSNGLEGIAAIHSDALLCLDELGQASGRTIAEASYMLANGMGKSRAYTDGTARAAKTWRLLVLSTGEVGLADKIKEEGGTVHAGQSVRLVDVPADAGAGLGIFEDLHGHTSPQAFSDALKAAAVENYGHAARTFVEHIQGEGRGVVTNGVRGFIDRGLSDFCPPDADGQVKRVARRFLLCAAAGELASGWGIVPWGEGKVVQAVRTCFESWLV
ncbi:MAG: DUF927 domain-containing protein, partial [Desulfovibrio sp.]|nr:DUF927 domain-containing protein [Desulfovibrio sp.]